jgi:hypothetical protein
MNFWKKARLLVRGKLFKPNLMFVGKAMTLEDNTRKDPPSVAHKSWTRVEKLARDKHSSLLRKLLIYERKKVLITLGQGSNIIKLICL